MFVSVSVLKDSLSVTILAKENGQFVSTSNVFELHPDGKLGHVPYERLRAMGDGVHELSEGEQGVAWMPRKGGPQSTSAWLGISVVALLLAVGGYWMFDNWEAEGGRMRINRIVAIIYALGGKQGVAGVFGAASVVSLIMGAKTWTTGNQRMDEKRQVLTDYLKGILTGKSRIAIDDAQTLQGSFVAHDSGQLLLLIPQDFLTPDEEKRARKMLGQPQSGRPDPEFAEATPPQVYSEKLDSDATAAATRVLEVMSQVYGLHPYFELNVHSHVSFPADVQNASSNDEHFPTQPPLVTA